MSVIHLFVDDLRRCPPGFTLARSGEEALLLLKECRVQVLSLDHDMGWDQMNGTQLAQEMVRQGLYAERIYLHSSNAMGRAAMFQLLYKNKPEGVRISSQPVPYDVLARIAAGEKPFSEEDKKRSGGETE